MCTDHDLKHLLQVSLATFQLPVFVCVQLPTNLAASQPIQCPKHICVSICPKPMKDDNNKIDIMCVYWDNYYCHCNSMSPSVCINLNGV